MRSNKFLSIYNDLLGKIQDGVWQSGEKLPSENELVEQYSTSRETVRKALNLLSVNGFIQKLRGKGSIVLDASKYDFPVSGLVSFKELAEKMGKPSETIVHELELLEEPSNKLRHNMQLEGSGEPVWRVIRGRRIENENVILDKDFIRAEVVRGLTREICGNSIYEYVEGELGLTISFAKKEITVETVTEEDRTYLDLKDDRHVVVVKNFVYLDDATLLTREICRNSIYEYVEGKLGLTISFAKKEITVETVTEEDRKYLDLKDDRHVVVVKNFVYLDDATLFQYTESRHRLDKFRFVDFARRKG